MNSENENRWILSVRASLGVLALSLSLMSLCRLQLLVGYWNGMAVEPVQESVALAGQILLQGLWSDFQYVMLLIPVLFAVLAWQQWKMIWSTRLLGFAFSWLCGGMLIYLTAWYLKSDGLTGRFFLAVFLLIVAVLLFNYMFTEIYIKLLHSAENLKNDGVYLGKIRFQIRFSVLFLVVLIFLSLKLNSVVDKQMENSVSLKLAVNPVWSLIDSIAGLK